MGLAFFIGAHFVPGVKVDSYSAALIAAVLIAVVNATLGTLLRLLTFFVNLLTFGLISFIITVLMIKLVDNWMTSISIKNFMSAALLAIVVSLSNIIIDRLVFGKEER
jgi:putative membrane protein